MEALPIPAALRAFAPDIGDYLAVIMASLGELIRRTLQREPFNTGLFLPLCGRLARAVGRFQRLMDRIAAGRPARSGGPGRSGTPRIALPTGLGWLMRALHDDARNCRTQLKYLLAIPEAAELFALVPQAARILRPICRMLGLDPGLLPALPRRERSPRPQAPRREQSPRPPRPKPFVMEHHESPLLAPRPVRRLVRRQPAAPPSRTEGPAARRPLPTGVAKPA